MTCVLLAGSPVAAGERSAGGKAPPAAALRQLTEMRKRVGCTTAPIADFWQDLTYRGRPAVEIWGRDSADPGGGKVYDFTVFDRAAGRIVAYVCHANVSKRQAGETIMSLGEISSIAERLARQITPGFEPALESILRFRASGGESVYYEARYALLQTEFPFFDPPVRLLFNASTGSLFRLGIDADCLDPEAPPRATISHKEAEKIAASALRASDLESVLGKGTTVRTIAAGEMYRVRPNGWLGFYTGDPQARARVAWVVPFRTDGGDTPGTHSLFIDAATGRIIGGLARGTSGPMPR